MMIHDFTDIFVNMIMIALEVQTLVHQLFINSFLVSFWIYLRMYFFGKWIIVNYYYEILEFNHKV